MEIITSEFSENFVYITYAHLGDIYREVNCMKRIIVAIGCVLLTLAFSKMWHYFTYRIEPAPYVFVAVFMLAAAACFAYGFDA